jgi:hypothetical protein
MQILALYRLYIAFLSGVAGWFLFHRSIWIAIGIGILTRLTWWIIEHQLNLWRQERDFAAHITPFKQLLGPYGIRLANKAETDRFVRKNLTEVFTSDSGKLREVVKQLEMLDALFQAGMRPEGDAWLLHDCKLKYARHRLSGGDAS